MARKARTPKQKADVKGRWFARGLRQVTETARSKPKPAANVSINADPPINVDEAAYQIGAAVAWLEFFQRCAWAYGSGGCDSNVHLALDSILECVDRLRMAPGAADRLDRVDQLAKAARQIWEAQFGSDDHCETVRRSKDGSDHSRASTAIKIMMAQAPLNEECKQLRSAVTTLGTRLGKKGKGLIGLGTAVATCEIDLHDGRGTADEVKDHLESLAASCSAQEIPEGITGLIRTAVKEHGAHDHVLGIHGVVVSVHNAIRQHLAGGTDKKPFKLRRRHLRVLRALLLLREAQPKTEFQTRDVIARVIDEKLDPDSFSHEIADLAREGYIETQPQRGGGCKLLKRGKEVAKLNSGIRLKSEE